MSQAVQHDLRQAAATADAAEELAEAQNVPIGDIMEEQHEETRQEFRERNRAILEQLAHDHRRDL